MSPDYYEEPEPKDDEEKIIPIKEVGGPAEPELNVNLGLSDINDDEECACGPQLDNEDLLQFKEQFEVSTPWLRIKLSTTTLSMSELVNIADHVKSGFSHSTKTKIPGEYYG